MEGEVLKHYEERIVLIHRRYWSHDKRVRIDYDLRLDHGDKSLKKWFENCIGRVTKPSGIAGILKNIVDC